MRALLAALPRRSAEAELASLVARVVGCDPGLVFLTRTESHNMPNRLWQGDVWNKRWVIAVAVSTDGRAGGVAMEAHHRLNPGSIGFDSILVVGKDESGTWQLLDVVEGPGPNLRSALATVSGLQHLGERPAVILPPLPREIPLLEAVHETPHRLLGPKDDSDILYIKRAGEARMRRIHNSMTTHMRGCAPFVGKRITEGTLEVALYDALVGEFSEGRDLLVEVKATADIGSVRLAVGQLLDYRRSLPKREVTSLAILLPERPEEHVRAFLRDIGIRLFYFTSQSLEAITEEAGPAPAEGRAPPASARGAGARPRRTRR
jgi:hypothetical protein